jgi:hypothetical protein
MNCFLPGIYYHDGNLSESGTLVAKGENKNFSLIMDGIFFDNETGQDDAALALELYEKNGAKSLVERNGNFNIAVLHKNSGHIEFISDVLATKPWYFYIKNSVFSVAPTPSFFAENDLEMELNRDAVFETVLYNYTLSDHTLIKEVSRNKPFHHFALTEKAGNFIKNYQLQIPEKKKYDTREKMAERIHEIIDRNIKSITDHKLLKHLSVQLPLTGGFDSRHILGALLKNKKNPILFRHIDIQKIDVEPVKIISKDLNIPLKLKDISEIDYRTITEEWLKRTGGLTNFHQNYLFDLMLDMPQKQMIGFDGYLMDCLLGIRPLFKLKSNIVPSDAVIKRSYGSKKNHRVLFKDYKLLSSKCIERVQNMGNTLNGNNIEQGLVLQILSRSVKYTGAVYPVSGDNLLSFAPGACFDAFDFAFNSSWNEGMYNKARFLMLEQYYPRMNEYPSIFGVRFSELAKNTSNSLLKEKLRKTFVSGILKNIALLVPLVTNGLFEPVKEDEHYWLRKIDVLKNLMERFVDNSLIAKDGYIEEASLKKIWKKHKSGAFNAWTMMNLLTIECAYRTLVKKEAPESIIKNIFPTNK